MQRFHPIANAQAAIEYFGRTDGQGYYLDGSDLHREWTGEGAKRLGLTNPPDFEQFKRLIQGLDPHTGEQLTAKIVDNRIPAWDITSSIPKGVTTALEMGDDRIHQALWEANREAMADLERYITTRVRKGDEQDDRITANMVCFSTEHPETRPAKSDNMPDPDRHIHNVVMNLTYDQVEGEWKAVKFRPIMDQRKFFDRSFDLRLSSKLAELGYQIETKYKPDEKGGKRYFSWDIKGIPDSVVKKFSRRSAEVETLAEELGVLSPMGKDKLGATSRQFKRKDMTLADYREYWQSRITPDEAKQISATILKAMSGKNPKTEPKAPQAVEYAFLHQFERRSVVDWHDLAVTAMERAMGGAMPEDIQPEAFKQGLLLKDGLATTRDVLAQEGRVVAWASEGRGTCQGLRAGLDTDSPGFLLPSRTPDGDSIRVSIHAAAANIDLGTLSEQQQAAVKHVWESPDRVILIRGGAGTGKTHMMKAAIDGIDLPTVVLAPSSDASRGVLRKEGFKQADTLAKFLMDEKFQENARNGVIWVDEAGQVSMRQLDHLFQIAESLDARVVLQGDKKQHGAIERGATLRVLEEFAGLPVAELTDIKRQKGDYKKVVASIQKGDILAGYDKLASMGWVHQAFDHNKPLVDDYLSSINRGKSVLVVAPTHAEGDEITAEIRKRLKETPVRGKDGKIVKDKEKQPVMRLGAEEVVFDQLKPLAWTEAEKGDRDRYDGSEIIQFVRNSGRHRSGDRVAANQLLSDGSKLQGNHLSVFQPAEIALSTGDQIRITAGGKSKDGHRLDTGAVYTVKGFKEPDSRSSDETAIPSYDIELSNGWVLDGSKALHIDHAYVSTSHASQGKTVDRVLIAMGGESRPAINAEQFYVSVSRGRDSAQIYTSLSPANLRDAIQKSDTRMTATELMTPVEVPKRKAKLKDVWKRVQKAYKRILERYQETKQPTKAKELAYER
ncbi:MobF family relaxase [Singulisphaera rosea]